VNKVEGELDRMFGKSVGGRGGKNRKLKNILATYVCKSGEECNVSILLISAYIGMRKITKMQFL
jgi:hypothetical protein